MFSNAAGKKTITVTSGAASSTATVVFAAAAGNPGAVLTITAPDYVAPGPVSATDLTLPTCNPG